MKSKGSAPLEIKGSGTRLSHFEIGSDNPCYQHLSEWKGLIGRLYLHVRPIRGSWIDLIWRAATITCTVPHKI